MSRFMLVLVVMVVGCQAPAGEAELELEPVAGGEIRELAELAPAACDAGAAAPASVPEHVVYAVTFERRSDGEPGACGHDLDDFLDRLELDAGVAAWYPDGYPSDRAEALVVRRAGGFRVSPATPPATQNGTLYPLGPCEAAVAGGGFSCELERRWIDETGELRCFNRYLVRGAPL